MIEEINIRMLKEIEHQVTIAVGTLSLVEGDGEEDKTFINTAKAQLTGIIYGIRNVIDHAKPMTIGELEDRQFEKAIDIIPEQDCSDVYPGLY